MTRTAVELSIICPQENVPPEAEAARGWCCIKVNGTFGFAVSGVPGSLAMPLAEANISVLAVATYETDHLLVNEQDLQSAVDVLTVLATHLRLSFSSFSTPFVCW